MNDFLQLTVAGLSNGAIYALMGVAFGLILSVTGRFHFAFTFTYALSAYIASQVAESLGTPFWLSMACGAAAALIVGVAIEQFIYRPLARKAGSYSLLIIFVASLGLSIIGTNLISLIWIDSGSRQINGFANVGYNLGSIVVTKLEIVQVAIAVIIIAILGVIVTFTDVGRIVRAVQVNPEMSRVVGIDPERVYLVVFAVASAMGGVAGVLDATKTAAKPGMGFNPLFYAFVVAFIAGLGSHPIRVGITGIILGLVESWSALAIPIQYTPLVVFTILFIYVAFLPVRFKDLFSRVTSATVD